MEGVDSGKARQQREELAYLRKPWLRSRAKNMTAREQAMDADINDFMSLMSEQLQFERAKMDQNNLFKPVRMEHVRRPSYITTMKEPRAEARIARSNSMHQRGVSQVEIMPKQRSEKDLLVPGGRPTSSSTAGVGHVPADRSEGHSSLQAQERAL